MLETPEFVRDVEPIFMRAAIPADREVLSFIVELPLLSACQDLFDKNVRTVLSSANENDIRTGFAYISLDCSTMSDQNLGVVDDLGLDTWSVALPTGGELKLGRLKFPVDVDTRVEELSRRALESTVLFTLQPKLWA